MIYIIILCIFPCLVTFNGYAEPTCKGNFREFFSALTKEKRTSLFISKLTFHCDAPLDAHEFFELTNLKEQTTYSYQDIYRACKFLDTKKRFSTINLSCTDYKNGKYLHFDLTAHWVFKKLSITGVWFGIQKYAALYVQQPGDIFDMQLHEESLKSIKKTLNDEGYFNHIVTDELIYSKKRKTIHVRIALKRHKKFSINTLSFEIKDFDKYIHNQGKDIKRLPHALKRSFGTSFIRRSYSKNRIIKHIEKIRAYLKKKNFFNCRLAFTRTINKEQNIVDIVFHLFLGKRKILRTSGNYYFSDKEINEEIIGSDEPDWLFSPDIITEQIMHAYYKKGFWETRVTHHPLDHTGYHFIIDEGPPTIISNIVIKEGSEFLNLDSAFFWPELTRDHQFDQSQLDLGLERLKNFYYSQGHWDFSVVGQRFFKNYDTNHYTIRILVSRGLQRFWGGFEIDGFKELETTEFFKKYQIPPSNSYPVTFNYNWLAQQRLFLINYFQNLGYWYVDVQPTFEITHLEPQQLKIFVRWNIVPGKRVRFGKLIMQGDTKLPFKRILRDVKFKEGHLWKNEKIDLTRKKLKRLDLFKSVHITPLDLAKQTSKKPIVLSLIDDDPLEGRFRLGYFLTSKNFLFRQESTPKVGASLVVRNPSNHADKLCLEFDWTRFERKLDFDYQQPSFFGLSFTGKFKGYANKYVHPVRIGSSSSAYEAIQHGFLIGINDEYKKDYFWGINIGNEWMKTSRVRGFLNFDKALIDKTLPFFFIEPSILVDKLDNRIDPHQGTLTFIALKTMIPENHGSLFARFIIEQSFFHSFLNDTITFASRIRLGHIFRRSFDQIMPVERFYLGGPYSVRGYTKDAIPPIGVTEKTADGTIVREYTIKNDVQLSSDPSITREFTIQGGATMINGNLEIRFPFIGSLGGVVFQDIGVLSQIGFLGLNDTWYPTSGLGLRYKTPIGAIRFDIGWKWKHHLPGDSRYAWYLTIGEAF